MTKKKYYLDGIEVVIKNEFDYEGEKWVEVEPVNFKSISREVKKSRLEEGK